MVCVGHWGSPYSRHPESKSLFVFAASFDAAVGQLTFLWQLEESHSEEDGRTVRVRTTGTRLTWEGRHGKGKKAGEKAMESWLFTLVFAPSLLFLTAQSA